MGTTTATPIHRAKTSRFPERRLSLTTPLRVFAVSLWACLIVLLAREAYLYWEDDLVIGFLGAWIPFVISILLAFIPQDLEMRTKWLWRAAIITAGFVYSLILWQGKKLDLQSAQASQQQLLNSANEHADKQISRVRTDVQGVKSDVGGVKSDLQSTKQDLSKMFSESTQNITSSISKVGKPDPPQKSRVIFTFIKQNMMMSEFPLTETSAEVENDVVRVSVSSMVTNDEAAKQGTITIRLCIPCTWAEETPGLSNESGEGKESHDRVKHFTSLLPNTLLTPIPLNIGVKGILAGKIAITGYVACENCPPINPEKGQTVWVNLIRPPQVIQTLPQLPQLTPTPR